MAMTLPYPSSQPDEILEGLQKKLWIYTNYDCNLRCTYCVAESSPKSDRRALSLDFVINLLDEAQAFGFEQIYFTGGEPFILPEIYPMLAYACERFQTTVLTNAMLFQGRRLEKLKAIQSERLTVQVSLDSHQPAGHDPYRGRGSWLRTKQGLETLLEIGFRVRLSSTLTPINTGHLDEICAFHQSLGIPEEDHIVRPLAKRGLSREGLEVGKHNLAPEITVNVDGAYWHPLSTDIDLRVCDRVFPLADVVSQVIAELLVIQEAAQANLKPFQ
jgi:MoaA/NifB/PqqE/SkfB family radical SAM enzyme